VLFRSERDSNVVLVGCSGCERDSNMVLVGCRGCERDSNMVLVGCRVCERDSNMVLVGCRGCERDSNISTLVDTVLMMLNHLQLPYGLLVTKLWAPNPGGHEISHNLAANFWFGLSWLLCGIVLVA
jgi:hypothetical protein